MLRLFNLFEEFLDKESGQVIKAGWNKIIEPHYSRLIAELEERAKNEVKEIKAAVEKEDDSTFAPKPFSFQSKKDDSIKD